MADEVRAQMARKRVTQRELGEALGVSPMWVSNRVSGQCPFRVEDILLVAQQLGVPVADLLAPVETALSEQLGSAA